MLNKIYADYSSYPSPLMGHFIPERDDVFLDIFHKNIQPYCQKHKLSSVLEIGCFDGYVLHKLQKIGFDVTGCDPSIGADIGKQFGVNIKKQMFNSDYFYSQNIFFDIVISRHFIEHVVDPKTLVDDMKKVLKPEGLLIIETPNVNYYIKHGIMDVFPTHPGIFFSLTRVFTL